MHEFQKKRDRMISSHINPKLLTKPAGWSIPIWMIDQINQIADTAGVTSSSVVRELLSIGLDVKLGSGQRKVDSQFLHLTNLEDKISRLDPQRKSVIPGWCMPKWIVDEVAYRAKQRGEKVSRIARELMEQAIEK